jgi:hypothetical protein
MPEPSMVRAIALGDGDGIAVNDITTDHIRKTNRSRV